VGVAEGDLFGCVAVEVLAVGISQAQRKKSHDGRYGFVGVPCMERRRAEITAVENDRGFTTVMLAQGVADALRLSGQFVKRKAERWTLTLAVWSKSDKADFDFHVTLPPYVDESDRVSPDFAVLH